MIADSVRQQSIQIFKNIESIFDVVTDGNIGSRIGVFPVWKQLYHLLHSMDKNWIDPSDYVEPAFHVKNLDIIFLESDTALDRDTLYRYFIQVRERLETYLAGLDDAALERKIRFRDLELTGLELILAQFRHIFYHIGYLHCCFKLLHGETPEYAGLYQAVPEK